MTLRRSNDRHGGTWPESGLARRVAFRRALQHPHGPETDVWLETLESGAPEEGDARDADPEYVARLFRALAARAHTPTVERARDWCLDTARRLGARSILVHDLRRRCDEGPIGDDSLDAFETIGGVDLRAAAAGHHLREHPLGDASRASTPGATDCFLLGYAFEHGLGRQRSEVDALAWYALALRRCKPGDLPELRLRLDRLGRRRAATPEAVRPRAGAMYLSCVELREIAEAIANCSWYGCRDDAAIWWAKAAFEGDASAFRALDAAAWRRR